MKEDHSTPMGRSKPTIPEIRAGLLLLADQMERSGVDEAFCETVRQHARDTVRRSPLVPVTRAKARRMTPELQDELRTYKLAHPLMSNREVGRAFGVDGGRVSEAIHGLAFQSRGK